MKLTGTNRPCGLTIFPLLLETLKDLFFQICRADTQVRPYQNRNRHKVSGGHSAGATPDPIPNSVVKPGNADDTSWATAWENRTPPELISIAVSPPLDRGGLFY